MVQDLSTRHDLVGNLFRPATKDDWERYRLSEDQVAFFNEQVYLKGKRMNDEGQVEALSSELSELMKPSHPWHHLFKEYHSNEYLDTNKVLLHYLGAWRILTGFNDI